MANKSTPWGDEILAEMPIFKGQHGFIARVLKKATGEKYIDISKFGPKPGTNDYYSQRLRLFKAKHWNELKFAIEERLSKLMDWDTDSEISSLDIQSIEKLAKQVEKERDVGKKKTKRIRQQSCRAKAASPPSCVARG